MEFRWIEWNIDKVVDHGQNARPEPRALARADVAADPYPQHRQDDKFLVWGATTAGRLLQVVFPLDQDDSVFIIHARPLTEREKRRRRRQRRRKGQS